MTDLAAIIAARRKHIRDSAPCVDCGASLAACMAERGKDPTAPEWFGCCARPLLDGPAGRCRHVPSSSALFELLDEIESGAVRTVEQVQAATKSREAGMSWPDYVNQGEKWHPNGKPMVAIADMDPEWRYNASRWLERRAAVIAEKRSRHEQIWFAVECASTLGPSEASADGILRDIEARAAERAADPVSWIRTTPLYRALVADLPHCSAALTAIADRAKHYSTCPVRTGDGEGCRCEALAAQCDRCRGGDTCIVCSGSGCGFCPECSPGVPEWTI